MDQQSITYDTKSRYPEIDYDTQTSERSFILSKKLNRDRCVNLSGSATESQKLRFRIPSGAQFLNPMRTYFTFDLTIKGTNTSYKREVCTLSKTGISSIIREFRVSLGGSTIEKIDQYDVISRILQLRMPEDYRKKVGQVEGIFDDNLYNDYTERKKYTFEYGTLTIPNWATGAAVVQPQLSVVNNANSTMIRLEDIIPPFSATDKPVNAKAYMYIPHLGKKFELTHFVTDNNGTVNLEANVIDRADYLADVNSSATTPIAIDLSVFNVYIETSIPYSKQQILYKNSGTDTKKQYIHIPYTSGFFHNDKYFPLFCNRNDLEVEITLNNNDQVFDGNRLTGVSYEINDAHIIYELLTPHQNFITSIQEKYLKSGLNFPMKYYSTVERSLVSSSEINEDYMESLTVLNRMYLLSRPSNYNTGSQNSYNFESMNPSDSFYIEINRERFPSEQFDQSFATDLFIKNHISEGTFNHNLFSNLSLLEYKDFGSQVLEVNLERYQNGHLTGVNINNTTARVIIKGVRQQTRAFMVIFEGSANLFLKSQEPLKLQK